MTGGREIPAAEAARASSTHPEAAELPSLPVGVRDGLTGPDPLAAVGDPGEWTDPAPYREFARLAAEGLPVALVTVVATEGSVPRGLGAAMVVRGDGTIVGTIGGGNLEQRMIRHALDCLDDGRPRRYHYDFSGGKWQNLAKACLGTTDFLVQPMLPAPHLVIFGAGHIGRALAPMARTAGFRVTVVDDRPGHPDPVFFPQDVVLRHTPFAESMAALGVDASSYGVIVTYGHPQDEEVLRAALRHPWRYLGMIGSRAKVARVFRSLSVDEEARRLLCRVRAPIGLPLGGRSPGEIAVGIVAELVAARHGRMEAGEDARLKPRARKAGGSGKEVNG